jgi:putative holliday junction resolvase
MTICNLTDLPGILQKNQTLLGIDYGQKLIGLATCDTMLSLATPLGTLQRGKLAEVVAQLRGYIESRKVGAIVLGLPLGLDGKDTPTTQAVRTFAVNLGKHDFPPICFWDERFSTKVIQRQLTEVADLSRNRRAEVVDKLAAAYILQGVLDFLRERQ